MCLRSNIFEGIDNDKVKKCYKENNELLLCCVAEKTANTCKRYVRVKQRIILTLKEKEAVYNTRQNEFNREANDWQKEPTVDREKQSV